MTVRGVRKTHISILQPSVYVSSGTSGVFSSVMVQNNTVLLCHVVCMSTHTHILTYNTTSTGHLIAFRNVSFNSKQTFSRDDCKRKDSSVI